MEFKRDVPHILQNDCYADSQKMCGAACVQMVLNSLKPKSSGSEPSPAGEQDRLYKQIQVSVGDDNGWYNPPDGVTKVLNDQSRRILKGSRFQFGILGGSPKRGLFGIRRAVKVDDQKEQIELLTKFLFRCVALRKAAPIVSVGEMNAHWIVVNGFLINEGVDDQNLPNAGREGDIEAIMIRNPLGRYTYRTKCCELAQWNEITGKNCDAVAYPQEIISYQTWLWEYMFCDWADTFVAIADGANPAAGTLLAQLMSLEPELPASETSDQEVRMMAIKNERLQIDSPKTQGDDHERKIQAPELLPQSGDDVSIGQVVENARTAVTKFKLNEKNEDVHPQKHDRPIPVQRLDRIDGDYYLVPFYVGSKIGALVSISRSGAINGAAVWPKGQEIPSFGSKPETLQRFVEEERRKLFGKKIRLSNGLAPLIKDVSLDAGQPIVWRRGPESSTPFRPSFNLRLHVEGRKEPVIFLQPVYDNCRPVDEEGALSLPPESFLQEMAEHIEARMRELGQETGGVVVESNRRGTAVMVKYQSKMNDAGPAFEREVEAVRTISCAYLREHSRIGLDRFRIMPFEKDREGFKVSGAGDPIRTTPPSGGGSLDSCFHLSTCLGVCSSPVW
jgi:hypothetical protein